MFCFTESLKQYIWKTRKEDYLLIVMFGHVELMDDEFKKDYLEWCQTEEGKQYLEGGSKYKPVRQGPRFG